MRIPNKCPICGSTSWKRINSYHTGFSLGKCVLGRMLFGRKGVLLGLVGKKRKVYACSDCHFVMDY